MTVTHDANTRFPATDNTASDTTAGDRTFSHAGLASAKGAVVVVASTGTVSEVTGVLYGGAAMSMWQSAVDITETGFLEVWVLVDQASFPTGTQTVTLQGCTAISKWATCSTVTCSVGTRTKVNASGKVDTTTAANPSITIVTSAPTLLYGGIVGGAAAPTDYAAGTGYTVQFGMDNGAKSARTQRRTTEVAPGSIAYGFTAVSDDYCMAAVALEEYTPSAGSPLVEVLMAPRVAP